MVRKYRRLARFIALTDWLAILAAFSLAYVLRFGLTQPHPDFVLVTLLAPPLWVGLFAGWRLYAIHRYAAAEEFRRLLAAISIGISLVVTVSFWSKASFSRLWIALAWLLSLALVIGERRLWHNWLGRRRRPTRLRTRTRVRA